MGFTFEVRQTDLLGRIGTLNFNGRKLETPFLFPVVHPVAQTLGLEEIRQIGFGGIMTNSYILYRRRREEALRQGIHRLLGFDGVIMTDSGGYQVLEYGDVDVSFSEIAEFQSKIGSDLAVTLDRPTGHEASRRRATETADYSNRNALATMERFGDSATAWVGPVQGGLHAGILSDSAAKLVGAGFDYLALGSPVQVMENYMYADLVGMIAATRRSTPYAVPLHLFGAGHPHTMAISVALGCDTFDSASYILFARQGRYMTERGAAPIKEMKYLPCSCPVCRGRSVGSFLDMDARESSLLLAKHNLHALRTEVELCKEAISEGRLWDLVEERAVSHPSLFGALRRFSSLSRLMAAGTQAMKERGLFVRGGIDEARPELEIARERLRGAQRRNSRRALLVAADRQVPLGRLVPGWGSGLAPGHDVYVLHPQLGPYPAELDFVYPFTQTSTTNIDDVWRRSRQAVRTLRGFGYQRVQVVFVDENGRVAPVALRSRPRKGVSAPSPRPASSRARAPRRP